MTNFMNKYMKFLSVFAVVFALAPMTAKSQSMQEFLQSSYDNHPELLTQIQSAYQNYERDYRGAVEGILPTIGYSYTSSYERTFNAAVDTDTTQAGIQPATTKRRTKGQGWGLEQNLFSSFRDYFELRGFLDSAYALKMNYYHSEQEFMQAAIRSYLDVIRSDNIVKVRRSNLASLQERLRIVERLYSVGDATELDLRQSSGQLLVAESDLEDSIADYEGALATFRSLGAIEADKNNMALPALPENIPASLEEGEGLVVTNNFSLKNLDAVQKARKSAYRARLGTVGPQVNFSATWGRTSRVNQGVRGGARQDVDVPYSRSLTTDVTIAVPLYNPQHSSFIRAAHKAYLASKNSYVANRLANINTFQSNWATYSRLQNSVELRRQAVESAEIALENVVLQQRAGLRSIVDVLDEERRLIQAQVAYEGSQFEYLTTAYSLLASTGRLTAKDLGLQTKYGEQLESYFTQQKYLGSLPGVVTAVQGLGGEFLDLAD